jgi:hypothetical protein
MTSESAAIRVGLPGAFVATNVAGGIAVLASYVYGMGDPVFTGGMWGGVPDALRLLYTVSMLLAAAGYFPMTAYVLLRLWKRDASIAGLGFAPITVCYGMFLIASALWVPFTLAFLNAPSSAAWLAVRGVLFIAALGSIGVLASLFVAQPRDRGSFWKLAVASCLLFCNQTVLLDALVWPYFFPTAA